MKYLRISVETGMTLRLLIQKTTQRLIFFIISKKNADIYRFINCGVLPRGNTSPKGTNTHRPNTDFRWFKGWWIQMDMLTIVGIANTARFHLDLPKICKSSFGQSAGKQLFGKRYRHAYSPTELKRYAIKHMLFTFRQETMHSYSAWKERKTVAKERNLMAGILKCCAALYPLSHAAKKCARASLLIVLTGFMWWKII